MSGRAPGEGLYRLLLHCHPRWFRRACGEELVGFYRERWQEAVRERRRLRFWRRVYADAVLSGLAGRFAPPRWHPNHQTGRSGGMGTQLMQDLRFARRALLRAPAFTLVVLATLALGTGANVAIFSVVNGVLLRPLPFAAPERLVQLANGDAPSTLSEPELIDLTRSVRAFSSVGAYAFADGNVTGQQVERIRLARVNAGFFGTLQPAPLLGRTFTSGEDRPGAPDVIVLSYALWQSQFGGDRGVIGRSIVVNDAARTVIGVLRPEFAFPAATVAAWTPLRLDPDSVWERRNHYLRVIARLAPGVSVPRAGAEMEAQRAAWARDYPDVYDPAEPLGVAVVPLRERVLGATAPYLLALLGAVGFVLLIACVNVASLLLARGEGRRTELMIRSALGAGRRRLAVQLLTENALLAAAGGVLGLALAFPLQRVLIAAAPPSIPRLGEVRMDATVLLFAAAVCLATGVLFTLAPLTRLFGVTSLAGLTRSSRNAAAGSRATRRLRAALVVGEIALAVVMLAGAGLFLRTLAALQRTDLGFVAENVLTVRLTVPRGPGAGERTVQLVAELAARVRALPGVTHAAAMAWTPIVDGGGNWSLAGSGAPEPATTAEAPTAAPQQVTEGFFETLSIPLLRGRTFTSSDAETAPLVAIVNQALARQLWGDADPIGERLRVFSEGTPWATVVGVVGDTRADGLTEPPPPTMYFPHAQAAQSAYFTALSMTLLVKSEAPRAGLVRDIRAAMAELAPGIPLSEIRTMEEVVGSTLTSHRFTTLLLSGFALLALGLAAIGIYGVIAYAVSQRRYEFGVRMALGAGRASVLTLVLREGLVLAGLGLGIGVLGAFATARVLRSLLADVGALDLPMLAAVSLLLATVALLALTLPARTAAGVNPTESLRSG